MSIVKNGFCFLGFNDLVVFVCICVNIKVSLFRGRELGS